jgi:hypothetical protein
MLFLSTSTVLSRLRYMFAPGFICQQHSPVCAHCAGGHPRAYAQPLMQSDMLLIEFPRPMCDAGLICCNEEPCVLHQSFTVMSCTPEPIRCTGFLSTLRVCSCMTAAHDSSTASIGRHDVRCYVHHGMPADMHESYDSQGLPPG